MAKQKTVKPRALPGPTIMRKRKPDNPLIEFPVDIHCYGCGESAKYQFAVEESRDEYLTLWHDWHSVTAPCDSEDHDYHADDCTRCGGTNEILTPKPGHKRIQLPWPPKRSRKRNQDEAMAPLLCEPPRLEYRRA